MILSIVCFLVLLLRAGVLVFQSHMPFRDAFHCVLSCVAICAGVLAFLLHTSLCDAFRCVVSYVAICGGVLAFQSYVIGTFQQTAKECLLQSS